MNDSPRYQPDAHANVCLLLEGTFPYVRGGVSSWVRQLIEGMPELSFSIVFLGGQPGDCQRLAYELPDNLVHLEVHYLLGSAAVPANHTPSGNPLRKGPAADGAISRIAASGMAAAVKRGWQRHWRSAGKAPKFERNQALHDALQQSGHEPSSVVAEGFTALLSGQDPIDQTELEQHRQAWQMICQRYQQAPSGLDFNHYFWTVRSIHAPLFTLARVLHDAPSADLYHSVSTGYAGWLGAMLRAQRGRPYLISEHGIYTKERALDLAQVDWIPETHDPFRVGLADEMGYLRGLWIRFFRSLGTMAYGSADQVYTLFEGNRQRQLADGAEARKLQIIPNGVNVARFSGLRTSGPGCDPGSGARAPVLALIGRVVPIKDIKTFVRAMRIVRARIPNAEGWLIGPEDEDPEYTAECKALASSLDLDDAVKFLGFQRPEAIFPRIGLSVLSSVSEGQPLVVLEGFAAGVPAVTTDVGSCRELIYGADDEDRALGSAGAVVPIANPSALAEAAMSLLEDADAWHAASEVAIARVERYYDERDMIDAYRREYTRYLTGVPCLQKVG